MCWYFQSQLYSSMSLIFLVHVFIVEIKNIEVLGTRNQTNFLDLLLIKKDLHIKFKIIFVISKLLV